MKKTILVVDNEREVVSMVALVLLRAGFLVHEALSGVEAIALCENAAVPIDLVLSDFEMPGMNGLQLAERLVSIRPGITVILMSASSPGLESIAARGFEFIEKPFSLDDLIGRITKRFSKESLLR